MISKVTNEDNMQMMARYPDKFFDLAIVDPPYGINADKGIQKNEGKYGYKKHKKTNWDENIPEESYFSEIFRVSKNQIICGANYFTKYLPATMGWVFWYKLQDNFSFSDGELIFTSFQTKTRIFKYGRGNESGFAPKGLFGGANIHPTQKPVGLYNFLINTYAKDGQSILDTHLGSGSSRIAAYDLGFDFYGCELDKDYFDAQEKRFAIHIAQQKLFTPQQQLSTQTTLL